MREFEEGIGNPFDTPVPGQSRRAAIDPGGLPGFPGSVLSRWRHASG